MHTEIFLIGLLIFSAHLFTSLFTKTKIPDVLLLMIVGILCGPVFNVASPDDFGKLGTIITTIALIVILFDGGSHISISALKSTFKDTIKLSLLTYIFSVALTIVAVHYYSGSKLVNCIYYWVYFRCCITCCCTSDDSGTRV